MLVGCVGPTVSAARSSVFAGRSGALVLGLHKQHSRYAATLAAAGGAVAMAASSTVESEAATNPLLHSGDFPLFDQVLIALFADRTVPPSAHQQPPRVSLPQLA